MCLLYREPREGEGESEPRTAMVMGRWVYARGREEKTRAERACFAEHYDDR